MRNILTEFMDDLREYVYESGANIAYDKRESIEFVDIFLNRKKDLDNVIDTLEKHNEWRRDNNVPPKTKMVSPKELGEAIDKAIEILKTLKP